MLAVRAEMGGMAADALLPKLRAARLYEAKRRQRFDEIAAEVVAAMAGQASPPIVSRGEVLATSAYPASEARHLHDLDLIVEDQAGAAAALLALGYEPVGPAGLLRHPSGMGVNLHSSPLPVEGGILTRRALAREARSGEIGGATMLFPREDLVLMHVILLASAVPGNRLTWAADGWMAARNIQDWSRIAEVEGPDAFWLLRGLGFLARDLDAAVPAHVLDRLSQSARRISLVDRAGVAKRAARLLGRRAVIRHAGRDLVRSLLRKRRG